MGCEYPEMVSVCRWVRVGGRVSTNTINISVNVE